MGCLILGIVVVSVEGLKNLDLSSNSEMNNVYAIVTLKGGALSEQRAQTNVNTKEGENPRLMKFIVDPSVVKQSLNSHLTFTFISKDLLEHKTIGEIKVSISELLQFAENGRSMQQVSCPVEESSGRTTNGKLNFKFKFIAAPPQAQAHPPHVPHHAQAVNLPQARPAPHVQKAAARKDGKWRDIGTRVAVGMGVSAAVASIGTLASDPTDSIDENLFYDEDGLSGTEISTFLDTSAFDPTDSFDENLFYDEDGLCGNEISTFLDTSAFDPTDSFNASSSFAGNLFNDQATSSSTANAAFPDSSVIESTTDAWLGTVVEAISYLFF